MSFPFLSNKMQVASVGPYGTSALWGWTRSTGKKQGDKFHDGIDATPYGVTSQDNVVVVSTCSGKVTQSRIVTDKSNATWEWGNYVTIQDTNGYYHTYAHLASRSVSVGDNVSEGQPIGIMGNTGNAANGYKHLHYRVGSSTSGKGIDPAPFMGIKNAVGIYEKESSKVVNDMKMKIVPEQKTAPRSYLIGEKWIEYIDADGVSHLFNPSEGRIASEVADDKSNISSVYESLKNKVQPGEIIIIVD